MLIGLMQDAPLRISGILKFAGKAHRTREIVSKLIDEPVWRYDWGGCEERGRRVAQALQALDVGMGDR